MQHMIRLANSDSARYTGASLVSGYECFEDPDIQVNMVVNNTVLIKDY